MSKPKAIVTKNNSLQSIYMYVNDDMCAQSKAQQLPQ